VILDRVIHALQTGSTEIAYLIFQAIGTPVVRRGFVLSVPGVTIEVAKECSSIRSSMAPCLLGAHLYLRTGWKNVPVRAFEPSCVDHQERDTTRHLDVPTIGFFSWGPQC